MKICINLNFYGVNFLMRIQKRMKFMSYQRKVYKNGIEWWICMKNSQGKKENSNNNATAFLNSIKVDFNNIIKIFSGFTSNKILNLLIYILYT